MTMNACARTAGLLLLYGSLASGEATHDAGSSAAGSVRPMADAIGALLLSLPIVGTDDRREWFEVTDPKLKNLARSTAVLIPKSSGYLETTSSGFRLSAKTPTHAEFDNLCSDVRYREQPAPGDCSGFLVKPDVLATARHCVAKGCADFHIVFDFHSKSLAGPTTQFSEEQVRSCTEILSQDETADWALLKLDRPTAKRTPFRVRAKGEPEEGTELAVLGHPRGLPLKIAAGAKVEKPGDNADPKVFLEAHLDAFGGNSGSPVINTETLEVEGIHTVGFGTFEEPTTDPKTGKPCRRLRAFPNPEDATPSWVTRASQFRAAIDAVK